MDSKKAEPNKITLHQAIANIEDSVVALLEDFARVFSEMDQGLINKSIKQIYTSIVAADVLITHDIDRIASGIEILNELVIIEQPLTYALASSCHNVAQLGAKEMWSSVLDLLGDFATVFNKIDDVVCDHHFTLENGSEISLVSASDGGNFSTEVLEYI